AFERIAPGRELFGRDEALRLRSNVHQHALAVDPDDRALDDLPLLERGQARDIHLLCRWGPLVEHGAHPSSDADRAVRSARQSLGRRVALLSCPRIRAAGIVVAWT